MFPACAFDSDDDRSVSSSGSACELGGIPNYSDNDVPSTTTRYTNTNTNNNNNASSSSSSSSQQGGNGLGRTNPLARHRDEYNHIYASSTTAGGSHGAMNLKELDAYVQETVRAQRQQRRKEACTYQVGPLVGICRHCGHHVGIVRLCVGRHVQQEACCQCQCCQQEEACPHPHSTLCSSGKLPNESVRRRVEYGTVFSRIDLSHGTNGRLWQVSARGMCGAYIVLLNVVLFFLFALYLYLTAPTIIMK